MSGNFKVGEVLIGQNFVCDTEYNGMECVCTGGLVYLYSIDSSTKKDVEGMAYEIKWADGVIGDCAPHNLRRKQPPSGEKSVLDMFKLPAPSKTMEMA